MEKTSRPAFSIITPSFNQAPFIRDTILSVLSQEGVTVEYLVFDGSSTDGTVDILREYSDRLQWISEPDRGQAHAVNKGLRSATCEYIGWLNSDDLYTPGALRAVSDFFSAHSDVDIVYGLADHVDSRGELLEPYPVEDWNYERLLEVCFICQPAAFFRKRAFERYGFLDENLQYCMDYEFWLRCGQVRPLAYLPRKLALSRLHADTKTLGQRVEVHREILWMMKRKFGAIPPRWIYNYVHVKLDAAGIRRDGPDLHRFRQRLVVGSALAFLRYNYFIPWSEMRRIIRFLR
jgi:glycosyltransferase involved in cell wall biosynthesis